ncbi:MAG: hypothetical protein AB8C95_06125 [Phycisphaeraceae bacterium]
MIKSHSLPGIVDPPPWPTDEDIAQAVSVVCKWWRHPREENDDITLVVVKLDA